MARSTLSLGMLAERAARMALRNRGFPSGSPPPVFAAIEISFDSLLKILPRLASMAPLKRFTFDHLLCPAIDSGRHNFCESSPGQKSGDSGNGRASKGNLGGGGLATLVQLYRYRFVNR